MFENKDNQKDAFEEKLIDIRRISKKTKGGNKIAFSVLCVVGNKEGSLGFAMGKASDTALAISKATSKARRSVFPIKLKENTIPHTVQAKYCASKVLLMPAPKGAGIIAGGAVRKLLEVSGIKDISAKMLGSSSKIGNVYATIKALKMLSK